MNGKPSRPITGFLAFVLKFLVTVPAIGILIFLAFANRSRITDFSWSPLHGDIALSLPVLVFGSAVFGFIWGSLIFWINSFSGRAERYALRRNLGELEKRLELQRIEYERLAARNASPVKEPVVPAPALTSSQQAELRSVTPGFMP